jgi:SAM-dependent methyltransferase
VTESWDDIAEWWIDAVRDEPAQASAMLAMLGELLPGTGGRTIDLGCGDGSALGQLGPSSIGTDLSRALLAHAAERGSVVQARLPQLSWIREGGVNRAVALGVLDLLPDHRAFFLATRRIVAAGGHLLVAINHPVVTTPGSEPLVDPTGEVLWRWGPYLSTGSWPQLAGDRMVELYHRPLGQLLTAAADAGWSLERLVEHGPDPTTISRSPTYRGQRDIPTLLGMRWTASHSPA